VTAAAVAAAHYRARRRLVRAAGEQAKRLWRQVDPGRIAASWDELAARMAIVLIAAQRSAAQGADLYLDHILAEQGLPVGAQGRVAVDALSGVAADGRALASLLRQPTIATLRSLSAGVPVGRALAGGYANLELIVRTEVADAGRVADQLALTARHGADGYVRMLSGKSCSRCAVLAGKRYGWNAGFRRHPRCDCIHIPAREDSADDLRTDPKAYFASLSKEDQDRLFTKSGAAAIREGADIGRVVNARRGMDVAGGRQLTTEATTRAGINRQLRLMPEQIFREAGTDRAEAIRLLRVHGYLI
jgi:hypothetical protein